MARVLQLVAMLWGTVWRLLLWALSPPRCSACDEPVRRVAVFCPLCARSVDQASPRVLSSGLSVFPFGDYGGALALAVQRFKYRDRPELANALGTLVARALPPGETMPELVVPVPLHPSRLAERGYNQAGLLARQVAATLRRPLRTAILRRVRATQPQRGLGRRDRQSNLQNAFRITRPAAVRNRHVLVVDDVVTTGATLLGCAEVLYAAGARQVTAAVVCSAMKTHDPSPDDGNSPPERSHLDLVGSHDSSNGRSASVGSVPPVGAGPVHGQTSP